MDSHFEFIQTTVDKDAVFLNKISQDIWKNPELKHEEVFAHNLLSEALEKRGFIVERKYVLPTAFRATFDSGKPGPTVATICEYDALPKIGHACGHNLIAETGLGAGLAVKAAIENFSEIPGKIVVLGTPAEEGGSGKVHLIKAGAFKDIDAAIMVHPGNANDLFPPFIAIQQIEVKYKGKETHASGYPWEGLNALDAAVACYNNLALLRQQIKPTCRVHAIISKGGDAPNVIPGNTEMQLYYRASSTLEMQQLWRRVESCIRSAATATGCEVEIRECENRYKSLITNSVLVNVYRDYSEKLGVQFKNDPSTCRFMASSDMGDVSHEVPSIHPIIWIGSKAANHSEEFAAASGAPAAQTYTLTATKALAAVALKVLCCSEVLDSSKAQFLEDLSKDSKL